MNFPTQSFSHLLITLLITLLLVTGCGGGGGGGSDEVPSSLPVIVSAPVDTSVDLGNQATFTVNAESNTEISYQWQRTVGNSDVFSNITGANSQLLMIRPSELADHNSLFRVIVKNSSGQSISHPARLHINNATGVIITSQPAPLTSQLGSIATFKVSAVSLSPLTYQWQTADYSDQVFTDMPGETTDSLALTVTLGHQEKIFRVVINGASEKKISNVVNLSITASPVAPEIMQMTTHTQTTENGDASFHAVVSGTTPILFQWQIHRPGDKDYKYSDIPGATTETLILRNVQITDNGNLYRLITRNSVGEAISPEASLRIVTPSTGTQKWNRIINLSMNEFQAGYFLDDNNGWLAGNKGVIIKTSNGGSTDLDWTTIYTPKKINPILGIQFANPTTGWIVGGAETHFTLDKETNTLIQDDNWGAVMKTTDGGETWVNQKIGNFSNPIVRYLSFIDASNGWISVSDKYILGTKDGGATWTDFSPNFSAHGIAANSTISSVQFLNNQKGWVAIEDDTSTPHILRTSDGGNTWQGTALPTCKCTIQNFKMLDSLTGWLSVATGSDRPAIYFTNDGGISWKWKSTYEANGYSGIAFTSSTRGYLMTRMGVIRKTIDGLVSQPIDISEASPIKSARILLSTPSGRLWALAGGSTLLYLDPKE